MIKINKSLFVILSFSLSAYAKVPSYTIPALKKAGISHSTIKHEFGWSTAYKYKSKDAYGLEIKFGKLTLQQFNFLKARYRNLSQVSYNSKRDYELVDFLPPVIQAVDRKQLVPGDTSFSWPNPKDIHNESGDYDIEDLFRWSDLKSRPSITTNCWGTSLNALRNIHEGAQQLELGWLSRTSIESRLSNPETFILVKASEVAFGDVMLIKSRDESSGEEIMQHAAVIIEPGLVFERTDETADDAFRLSLQTDVVDKMKSLFPDSLTISYFRKKEGAHIPSIADADSAISYSGVYGDYLTAEQLRSLIIGFEANALTGTFQAQISALRTIGLVKNVATERFELDQSNNDTHRFRNPPWLQPK